MQEALPGSEESCWAKLLSNFWSLSAVSLMLTQYCYHSLDYRLSFAVIFKELPYYCVQLNPPVTLKIENGENQSIRFCWHFYFLTPQITRYCLETTLTVTKSNADLHNRFQQRRICCEISVPKYSPSHANHTSFPSACRKQV